MCFCRVLIRESNRLKYRSGSGSGSKKFFLAVQFRFRFKTFQKFEFRFGSGSVAPKFRGSVRVHRNEIFKVLVRFGFTKFKF